METLKLDQKITLGRYQYKVSYISQRNSNTYYLCHPRELNWVVLREDLGMSEENIYNYAKRFPGFIDTEFFTGSFPEFDSLENLTNFVEDIKRRLDNNIKGFSKEISGSKRVCCIGGGDFPGVICKLIKTGIIFNPQGFNGRDRTGIYWINSDKNLCCAPKNKIDAETCNIVSCDDFMKYYESQLSVKTEKPIACQGSNKLEEIITEFLEKGVITDARGYSGGGTSSIYWIESGSLYGDFIDDSYRKKFNIVSPSEFRDKLLYGFKASSKTLACKGCPELVGYIGTFIHEGIIKPTSYLGKNSFFYYWIDKDNYLQCEVKLPDPSSFVVVTAHEFAKAYLGSELSETPKKETKPSKEESFKPQLSKLEPLTIVI
jgi:hypothetical protein